ncbi:MAG: hypothetical protein Q8P56_01270 [Candidatus Uhrbacteria bacterium]|nr:hypothetical protein [Candidatus Uhrbacteria bacterium]
MPGEIVSTVRIFEAIGSAKEGDMLTVTLKGNGAKGTRALLSQGERGLDASSMVWGTVRYCYLRSVWNPIPAQHTFVFTVLADFNPLRFATEIAVHAKEVALRRA